MTFNSSLRPWATALTIGAFALMALTGVLMFFHLDSGLNKAAHEWLGWALLVGVLAHVAVNWRAFTLHFKRRREIAIMAAFVAALGLSFAPLGGAGGSPAGASIQALVAAPLSAVAAVTGESPDALVARLAADGHVAAADRSIAQIAGEDRGARMALLKSALTR